MAKLVLIVTFAFMLSLGAAGQFTGGGTGVEAQPPTAGNQITILVTTIVGFASLIATQVFAIMRENRNRRWDLEDRMAARTEARRNAEAQRIETVATALELAKVSQQNREHLEEHIRRNTEVTLETHGLTREAKESAEAAFAAANNFNEKLETLKTELAGLAAKRKTIDHIDEVSSDTNAKVTQLKDKKNDDPARRR